MADKIYFLPVNPDFVSAVIEKERPDAIMLGFGGQTALNCGVGLARRGTLEKYGLKVLGTPISGIEITEDRELFKEAMQDIGVSVPRSKPAYSLEDARRIVKEIGYPVILRVAYTLGGRGGGVARNDRELAEIVQRGLNLSIAHQVLIEEYIGHWKQIEYEVMRDRIENSMVVCNMENVLSMRVHTGDNIVVAPSQTITNREYHMLRSLSLKAAAKCGILGRVQHAVRARAGVGAVQRHRDQRPSLQVVGPGVEGHRLPYSVHRREALPRVHPRGAQEQGHGRDYGPLRAVARLRRRQDAAVGHEEVRGGVEEHRDGHEVNRRGHGDRQDLRGVHPEGGQDAQHQVRRRRSRRFVETDDLAVLRARLKNPTDQIIFDVVEALMVGLPEDEVSRLSVIDPWFVSKLKNIAEMYGLITKSGKEGIERDPNLVRDAKRLGFSDKQIAAAVGMDEDHARSLRERMEIRPVTKVIDTLAAEWPARTNYLYMTFNGSEDEAKPTKARKVMVLGQARTASAARWSSTGGP